MAFHGSDYHGVAKQVLGEGPYAVEYAVLTGNGYFRKVEITRREGKHIGKNCNWNKKISLHG